MFIDSLTVVSISRFIDNDLASTLRSLGNQHILPRSLVLVVSTGDLFTLKRIVATYIPSDIHVSYVLGQDSSLYSAMNIGLSHVSSSYVLFLNAGDHFYSPLSLSIFNNDLKRFGVGHNFAYSVVLSELTNSRHVQWIRMPWLCGMPPHQAFFAFIKQPIFFDESLLISADIDWMSKLIQHHGIIYSPSVMSYFLLDGISSSYTFQAPATRNLILRCSNKVFF